VPVLIGLRRWRMLVMAGIVTIAATLSLTPLLGDSWASDYVRMIMSYDTVNAGPHFAWSLHPEKMSNLRGMLNVYLALQDDLASRISASVWLAGIAGLAILGLRYAISAARLWSFSILLYLLVCPHVSRPEIMHVVVVLSLSVPVVAGLSWREVVLLIGIPLVVFIPHLLGSPSAVFISLALLLVGLMVFPEKASTLPRAVAGE